jgi:hypothetical protein
VRAQVSKQVGAAGPEDLRRRLERARADLEMVEQLDGIALRKLTLVEGKADWASAPPAYREAFRRYGLLAVARHADPEPWQDRLRDASVWRDRRTLEALAKEADVARLSPAVVNLLSSLLGKAGSDRLSLLGAAQGQHRRFLAELSPGLCPGRCEPNDRSGWLLPGGGGPTAWRGRRVL